MTKLPTQNNSTRSSLTSGARAKLRLNRTKMELECLIALALTTKKMRDFSKFKANLVNYFVILIVICSFCWWRQCNSAHCQGIQINLHPNFHPSCSRPHTHSRTLSSPELRSTTAHFVGTLSKGLPPSWCFGRTWLVYHEPTKSFQFSAAKLRLHF